MKIAIDASNLLDGGGITHLKELLIEFSNINNTEFIVMVGSNSPFRTYAADNIRIEKIDAFDRNVFSEIIGCILILRSGSVMRKLTFCLIREEVILVLLNHM